MKFALFKQLDSMDCGPACLRIISRYYGKSISIRSLKEKCHFSREGVSLYGICIFQTTQQGTFYTVELTLHEGLTTNYGEKLPFNQEMKGSAEIVTESLSLFKRLFNPLKAVTKKSL